MNKDIIEQVAEYLDEKLGREASEKEIEDYLQELEAKAYDHDEEMLKGN